MGAMATSFTWVLGFKLRTVHLCESILPTKPSPQINDVILRNGPWESCHMVHEYQHGVQEWERVGIAPSSHHRLDNSDREVKCLLERLIWIRLYDRASVHGNVVIFRLL